jgi:chromosomal replication initiator protein
LVVTPPPEQGGAGASGDSRADGPALWSQILEFVRQEVNEQTFNTWFTQTRFLGLDHSQLRLQGPNQFFVDWLTEHHLDLLERHARLVLGPSIEVVVQVDPDPSPPTQNESRRHEIERSSSTESPAAPERAPRDAGLNPRYTFANFVVGENNQLASAACLAVADQLAYAYNPLFLYGGVGLGKTHLMQAIGNRVLERNGPAVVYYTSAENFMNELIQAIRSGRTFEFKNRYRNVDLLLIDDIQFLAGKESTQQEFFHTFNALYDANKQIVVTSDRPPKEISSLEERLRSRFEWGLITDIQQPNFETRMAILKKKVEKEDILIPDDVLVVIAESIQSNIRELEGALIRLLAFASLTNSDINVEMAKEVLSAFIHKKQPRRDLSISDIMREVSSVYGISLDLMRSKTRTKQVAHARQVAMYICREHTRSSLNQIGLRFGGRDHTTVHHAWQKVGDLRENDPEFGREYKQILERLQLR